MNRAWDGACAGNGGSRVDGGVDTRSPSRASLGRVSSTSANIPITGARGSFAGILIWSALPSALIAAAMVFVPTLVEPTASPALTASAPIAGLMDPASAHPPGDGGDTALSLGSLRLGTEDLRTAPGEAADFDVALAISRARERRSALVGNLERIDLLLDRARSEGIETTGILADLARPSQTVLKPRPLAPGQTMPLAFAAASFSPNAFTTDQLDVPETVSLYRLRLAIETIDQRIDHMELRQETLLTALERHVERRAKSLAAVPEALGLAAPPAPGDMALLLDPDIGGPLVPLDAAAPTAAISSRIERLERLLAYAQHLRGVVDRLPVRRPLAEGYRVSSSFGPRRDPFTGRLARHTGIDFRAATGTAVVTTAAGIVTQARRVGGYGKLVEIDHGNGFTTRYAHLSAIEVAEGDSVAAGDTIGQVGSTGRSTGPHLHYEVRASGVARNPARYLDAGHGLTIL